jgi:hypothetical protein
MVEQAELPISFKDVWFNGHKHLLPPAEEMGAVQAERFTDGLLRHGWSWNAAFDGNSVVIPQGEQLPVVQLAGGMTLTLLSPDWPKLRKLKPVWEKELKKAGLLEEKATVDVDPPGVESLGAIGVQEILDAARSTFAPDDSEANGSSICVLAEYDGRRAVLTGDAHVDRVMASLALMNDGAPVEVDAYKLSHHGSRGTHSSELMGLIECGRYLVSTDGSRHEHPHIEALARTIVHSTLPVELVFNYHGDVSSQWQSPAPKSHFGFKSTYPAPDENGIIRVEL